MVTIHSTPERPSAMLPVVVPPPPEDYSKYTRSEEQKDWPGRQYGTKKPKAYAKWMSKVGVAGDIFGVMISSQFTVEADNVDAAANCVFALVLHLHRKADGKDMPSADFVPPEGSKVVGDIPDGLYAFLTFSRNYFM